MKSLPRRIPLLAMMLCSVTVAGETTHVVEPGESASAIAKRYYGRYDRAELLLRYNGRSASLLEVGATLRVPYAERHRVGSGDSWSGLAQRYLGRTATYPALAALNGTSADRPLRIGEEVIIPAVVDHVLLPGETLSSLAERYLGDSGLGSILLSFNGFDDPRRLSVGQTVSVPVPSLELVARVEAETPAAEAEPALATPAPEPGPEPEFVSRFAEELESASFAYDAGEYARARDLLEMLNEPVLSAGNVHEQGELLRMLTYVYIAFDRAEASCSAYRRWKELGGGKDLDPDMVSPKIREQIARCPAGPGRASRVP